MTTTLLAMPIPPTSRAERLRWVVTDTLVVARRSYARLRAQPWELVGFLVFPIIMIVLFAYVFGSAITLPGGGNYREFLMEREHYWRPEVPEACMNYRL